MDVANYKTKLSSKTQAMNRQAIKTRFLSDSVQKQACGFPFGSEDLCRQQAPPPSKEVSVSCVLLSWAFYNSISKSSRYEASIIPATVPPAEGDTEVNPWPFKNMSDLIKDEESFSEVVEPIVFEYLNTAGFIVTASY